MNLTIREQEADTVLHPELSSEVEMNGFGNIVIEFVNEPIPMSSVDVFVVTENNPPTFLVFSRTFIANEYTIAVVDKQLLALHGLVTSIEVM